MSFGSEKQPVRPGTYVSYFDRFPSKEDYEGCKKLIEWYGAKYPGLRAQWEKRMRAYEFSQMTFL